MVVCLPGWALHDMSYKLAYASVISCWVGWELGGSANLGRGTLALFHMVPLFISRLVRIYLPGNGRVQKPNGSFARPLELRFAMSTPYACHIVLVQTDHEASRNWSVGEIDFFMEEPAKSMQRAWIQGRKVVGPYLQSILRPSFFLRYNISEIYLIINVVLEWL